MGEGWSVFRTNMTLTLGHLQFALCKLEAQLYNKFIPYVTDFQNYQVENRIVSRQPTYNNGGEGRSGQMSAIQAYDLAEGADVWAVFQGWNRATRFKAGDTHEEKSGSGAKLGGLNRTYEAIKANVLTRCMTSDTNSLLARMVRGQRYGIDLDDDRFPNFRKTSEQKREFDALYPWVHDTRNLVIEVPGREETLGPYEERSGLGLAGNLVEGTLLFLDDISVTAYYNWMIKRRNSFSKEFLEGLILRLMNDNTAYLRRATEEICDQQDKIEPMLEETLDKNLLLAFGSGPRSGSIGSAFEMRAGHAGFNDPKKIIYYIDMQNWPLVKRKIDEILRTHGREELRKKARAFVISESFGRGEKLPYINVKPLTKWLDRVGILPYVITANKSDRFLRTKKDRAIFIPEPPHYTLNHDYNISLFTESALETADSITSAWIRTAKRKISEEHKVD